MSPEPEMTPDGVERGSPEETCARQGAECQSTPAMTKSRSYATLLCLLLLFALPILVMYTYRTWMDGGDWVELYHVDFTAPMPDLEPIEFMDDTRRHLVETRPLDGGLWFDEGEWCWLRGIELPGDARLVIEFDTAGIADSIEVAINSRPEPVTKGHLLPAGQTLKLVINDENSISQLIAHGSPHFMGAGKGNVIGLSLPTSEAYTLEFRRMGGRISVLLNGKTIHEDFGLVPLQGEGLHRIGFRVWQPTTRILSLQVEAPRREPEPGVLFEADRLVGAGELDAAIQKYMDVASAAKGTPEAEEALFKSFMILAGSRYLHREHDLRNRIAIDMRAHDPNSTFTRYIMEEIVLLEMRMGAYKAMVDALMEILDGFPYSNIVEKLWAGRPNSLPTDVRDILMANYRSSRPSIDLGSTQIDAIPTDIGTEPSTRVVNMNFNLLETLDFDATNAQRIFMADHNRLRSLMGTPNPTLEFVLLSGNELRDLNALRGLGALSTLSARSNRLRNLDALSPISLPGLRELRLDWNFIDDPSPLQGHAHLGLLWLGHNRIRDLAPLADLKLWELHIHGNPISDLSPLAGMPLESLHAEGCMLEDLSPLRGMPLRSLRVEDNRIRSLAPLVGMPMETLILSNNPVSNPAPLLSMPLRRLAVDGTGIEDVDALLAIPSLHLLDVDADQFARLRSLGESGVTFLNVVGGHVEDLSPLRNWIDPDQEWKLPSAYSLGLNHHAVTNLDILQGKPLGILSLADNRITSILPLQGMPLEIFAASGNRIEDLAPLRDAPLHYLDLRFNRITSLEPLSRLEGLRMLSLGGNAIGDVEPLRALNRLQWLELQDNRLSDLEPLRTVPLNYLDISGNQISSLSPLAMMPLTVLRCAGNQIQSLAGLETRAVVELHAADNRIESLEPLLRSPLVILDCANNPVQDMDILARIPTLRELRCDARQVGLFTRIAETKLQTLRVVPGGGLDDVSSVAGMKTLRHLEIYGQGIEDSSMLVAPPLEYLDVSDNPLTTLGTLADAPPAVFLFQSDTIPDEELTRLLALWEGGEETARHARTVRILQAIRRKDTDALRAMGSRLGDSVYLYVPYSATWERAREMAEGLGGHLATIPRRDINTHVMGLLGEGERAWIGLQVVDGRRQWVRDTPRSSIRERLSSLHAHWFPSVIWHGSLYTPGRPGARWLDAYGAWHPAGQPDQRYGFIIEWNTPGN